MSFNKTTTLVFDMGGVLVDLRDPLITFGFPGSKQEFWQAWLGSPTVRSYELGKIQTDQFAQQIVAELQLRCSAELFITNLSNWLIPQSAEVIDLLSGLKQDYRLGLLSNTNPEHWHQVNSVAGFADLFDHLFLSFETGLLKPDWVAYEQLPTAFNCPASQIHFFDDNQLNVDAANRCGIAATLTPGIDALRDAIRDI